MSDEMCQYPTVYAGFCDRCGMDSDAVDHRQAPPGDAEPTDHAYTPAVLERCDHPRSAHLVATQYMLATCLGCANPAVALDGGRISDGPAGLHEFVAEPVKQRPTE